MELIAIIIIAPAFANLSGIVLPFPLVQTVTKEQVVSAKMPDKSALKDQVEIVRKRIKPEGIK